MSSQLTHVLWIGGATDSGKSTVADILAERWNAGVYHYDRHDVRHHQDLAQHHSKYQHFFHTTMDARWVTPEPKELYERSLASFQDRFPLVLQDLQSITTQPVIAEGFGLTPELVSPLLSHPSQAIWLVPTPQFKSESMLRRNKPSFRGETGDPERATRNLVSRDALLTQHIQSQAGARGLTVWEIDGSVAAEAMADRLENYFRLYLESGATKE